MHLAQKLRWGSQALNNTIDFVLGMEETPPAKMCSGRSRDITKMFFFFLSSF